MGGKFPELRSPKTGNERRSNAGAGRRFVRGKRRPKLLPSDWDDEPRGAQRSWKLNRQKQYREGASMTRAELISRLQEIADPHPMVNLPVTRPAHPAPTTTSQTTYQKYKRKGDKTSWNKSYKPKVKKLKQRIQGHYQNKHAGRQSGVGAGLGMAGGAIVGGAVGALAPKGFKESGIAIGAVLGAGVGGATGAHHGFKRGWKHGTARATRVNRMIPNKAGRVASLQKHEPRAARRFFSQKKNLVKNRKGAYHKDFRTKTTTTTARVVDSPGNAPHIKISKSSSRGTRRQVGSIKKGFSKRGYYREDIIEALIEAVSHRSRQDVVANLQDRRWPNTSGKSAMRLFSGPDEFNSRLPLTRGRVNAVRDREQSKNPIDRRVRGAIGDMERGRYAAGHSYDRKKWKASKTGQGLGRKTLKKAYKSDFHGKKPRGHNIGKVPF